jgi:predicted DNA binding CopG/RHH family protein
MILWDDRKNQRLNAEEEKLEADIAQFQPVNDAKKLLIEDLIDKANEKRRSISLRLKSNDLERLKRRAEAEGLPCQTLLTSIIHKFLSDQLVDRRSILNSIEILRKSDLMLPE